VKTGRSPPAQFSRIGVCALSTDPTIRTFDSRRIYAAGGAIASAMASEGTPHFLTRPCSDCLRDDAYECVAGRRLPTEKVVRAVSCGEIQWAHPLRQLRFPIDGFCEKIDRAGLSIASGVDPPKKFETDGSLRERDRGRR
jgi:hypothetical protein